MIVSYGGREDDRGVRRETLIGRRKGYTICWIIVKIKSDLRET